MHNPNNLRVLTRAFALVVAIHKSTFQQSARVGRRAPGLSGQLLRSATSISANIVEGADKQSAAQFAHYLATAIGSANETEHHLELAVALELFPTDGQHFIAEVREIRKMLHGLRKRVLEDAEQAALRKHQAPTR